MWDDYILSEPQHFSVFLYSNCCYWKEYIFYSFQNFLEFRIWTSLYGRNKSERSIGTATRLRANCCSTSEAQELMCRDVISRCATETHYGIVKPPFGKDAHIFERRRLTSAQDASSGPYINVSNFKSKARLGQTRPNLWAKCLFFLHTPKLHISYMSLSHRLNILNMTC